MSAMALIFLLPQISKLAIRRIPEYADNLGNLLLSSIERYSTLEGINSKFKNVGILLKSDDHDAVGRTGLLLAHSHPVTAIEKSTSLKHRSTDERAPGIDKAYKHPDGSLPFLNK